MSSTEPIDALLAEAGLPAAIGRCDLVAGRNNRITRLRLSDDRTLIAKDYFRSPNESHDRFSAETRFVRFCRDCGIRCVPNLIASNKAAGIAFFDDIEGERPTIAEARLVDAAVEFVLLVNRYRDTPQGQSLPDTSESCYSLADSLECVQRRLERLDFLPGDSPEDREAVEFVHGPMRDCWRSIESATRRRAGVSNIDSDEILIRSERCLSPSDFGIHNCLVTLSGQVMFLDFEYAGWDDPAKMIVDFFCQPEIPVPRELFPGVSKRVISGLGLTDVNRHLHRCQLLLPVHQIKWCCIMLNDFLPEISRRRRFADPDFDESVAKADQLAKARAAMERISISEESRAT